MCVPACTARGRAKASNCLAGSGVLELCHTVLPVSVMVLQEAVIPLEEIQHFWCNGKRRQALEEQNQQVKVGQFLQVCCAVT